jgi:hypothetical protein
LRLTREEEIGNPRFPAVVWVLVTSWTEIQKKNKKKKRGRKRFPYSGNL